MREGHDPVARSDAFDRVLERSPEHLSLVRVVNQHKYIIRWLIVIVIVLCGLIGYVSWVAVNARHAAQVAASAQTQNKTTCLAGNDFRLTEKQLWNFVLSFPPPLHETAEARKLRLVSTAKFKAYVDKKFAPRDCAHLTQVTKAKATLPTVPTPVVRPSEAAATSTTVPRQSSPSRAPTPSPTPRHSPHPSHPPHPRPTPSVCVTLDHLGHACLTPPPSGQSLGTVSVWQPPQNGLRRSTHTGTADVIMKTLAVSLVIGCLLLFVRAVIAG